MSLVVVDLFFFFFFFPLEYGYSKQVPVSKQTADTLLWLLPTFFTAAGLFSNDPNLW